MTQNSIVRRLFMILETEANSQSQDSLAFNRNREVTPFFQESLLMECRDNSYPKMFVTYSIGAAKAIGDEQQNR